jgi:antirestriction protein ArdC
MSNNQEEELAKMLIEAMEEGIALWMKPWAASAFRLHNGVTGHEYSGVNIVTLSLSPFDDPRYCTFLQAKTNGWKVKKGSRSFSVDLLRKHISYRIME